ncbi:MAG: c-type cytochrome [Burkholderiaceae bacterium]
MSLLLMFGGVAHAQPQPAVVAACAACHGAGGISRIPGIPSLAAQPKVFIENQLVLIREGLREVPVMKDVMAGMKDEDIVALAKHFAALPAGSNAEAARPDTERLGDQTARKMLCGTCHLPDYAGQQQVPRLAGQDETYLLQAMKQFRDNPGPGRDTIMSASLYGLSDADLANLAHHLSHFKR